MATEIMRVIAARLGGGTVGQRKTTAAEPLRVMDSTTWHRYTGHAEGYP
jgi:hypothetical protein